MKLLLAAGGTGGHVFPAIALANAARAAGHQATLLGGAHGMEERLAAEADLPFVGVATGRWDRQRPDPREAWRAVRGLAGAVRATRRIAPDIVVAFGGFASFPGCVASVVTRTPLLLHEGNAFPGRVTRWFAGRAAAVALAMPEAASHLPDARRVETVGFPVRETRVAQDEARSRLGVPGGGTLTLVMGGSQGSKALNERLPAIYRGLPIDDRGAVLHATGERWLASVAEAVSDLPDYRAVGFVDATLAWSAADLAIVRSGVGTLSEAALHGVPVVTVPLPTSAEDHQRVNARAIHTAGAGIAVEQDDAAALGEAWRTLLGGTARRAAALAMAARSPEGAALRLLDLAGRMIDTAKDEDPR